VEGVSGTCIFAVLSIVNQVEACCSLMVFLLQLC